MTKSANAKKCTTRLVSEIDPVELGVMLFEAVVGIRRPVGLPAEQAFMQLHQDDQARVLRAAKTAMEFCIAAINRGVEPQ